MKMPLFNLVMTKGSIEKMILSLEGSFMVFTVEIKTIISPWESMVKCERLHGEMLISFIFF
jgi:hypothetical protein